jgi:hypothetical protein
MVVVAPPAGTGLGPLTGTPTTDGPSRATATGAEALPPVEAAGDCGDAGATGFPVDDWVTDVEPAVVGGVVLWVTGLTELVPPAGAGWVDGWLTGWLADSSTDMLGFEPPLPLTGTVVVTGLTVVVVAAAGAVVGGGAGADVTGAAALVPLATVVVTGTLPVVP